MQMLEYRARRVWGHRTPPPHLALRHGVAAAASGHAAASGSEDAAGSDARIAAVMSALAAAHGGKGRGPPELIQPHLDQAIALGAALGVNRVVAQHVRGCLEGEFTSDVRGFVAGSDTTTLGRLSFNAFQPTDLQVDLSSGIAAQLRAGETGYPALYRGPFEGCDNAYLLFTHVRLIEPSPEAASQPPLYGVQTTVGEYEVVDGEGEGKVGGTRPQALMRIRFRKLRLAPAPSTSADPARLARWKALLGPHNPSMAAEGSLEVALPANGPVGTIEMLLMCDSWQIHKGNMGSYQVLKPYVPPAGTPGAALAAAAAAAGQHP
eukprot:CAMPEP_0202861038 /NCGR_PEP_ID=MMETSP1391-20130828/2574_1 /ASSEMBLY_ACC=CAM_ASM_000867 /TAXON_ID=1034604 /ORGANISM="Chlamydomonas leiostraca, Strain SAG 11-49" /LENGTH=320 /DNA_ID=CAMNT_0049540357 /DNA_START=135 /DNA_END=1098 /DNA_ORIENTATION=-